MFEAIFSRGKPSGSYKQSLLAPGELVYAIGDIHGRADLLNELFGLIRTDLAREGQSSERVTIVFLGDYVDRGLQSKAVIDLILAQDWGQIRTVFLKGNHEQTLLDFLEEPGIGPEWFEYGGRETLMSYGVTIPRLISDGSQWQQMAADFKKRLPTDHRMFLKNLMSWFELGQCYFVHAGVDPSKPMDKQQDSDRLWIRDRFLENTKRWERIVIHGHTPEAQPIWNGRRIGVDSGAYITNKLTAACIRGSAVKFLST